MLSVCKMRKLVLSICRHWDSLVYPRKLKQPLTFFPAHLLVTRSMRWSLWKKSHHIFQLQTHRISASCLLKHPYIKMSEHVTSTHACTHASLSVVNHSSMKQELLHKEVKGNRISWRVYAAKDTGDLAAGTGGCWQTCGAAPTGALRPSVLRSLHHQHHHHRGGCCCRRPRLLLLLHLFLPAASLASAQDLLHPWRGSYWRCADLSCLAFPLESWERSVRVSLRHFHTRICAKSLYLMFALHINRPFSSVEASSTAWYRSRTSLLLPFLLSLLLPGAHPALIPYPCHRLQDNQPQLPYDGRALGVVVGVGVAVGVGGALGWLKPGWVIQDAVGRRSLVLGHMRTRRHKINRAFSEIRRASQYSHTYTQWN